MRRLRITRDRQIQGGSSCLAGTRWPTRMVLGFDFDVAAIQSAYPHLSRDQITVAIWYERTWHRRLGRRVWIARRRLGAVLLGIPAEDVEDLG